jgi:hypothetical protein
MSYLALASGCKGLFWFLYQTEYWNKAKGDMMSGLIDTNDRGDARWADIGRFTEEISDLTPVLLKLEPVETKPDERETASTHILRDRKGRTYAFTVNLNTEAAAVVTTKVSVAKGEAARVTRIPNGKKMPAHRDNGYLVWSERLPAGSGALYRID